MDMPHIRLLRALLRDESGATAVEYCVVLAIVGTVTIASMIAIGDSANGSLAVVNDNLR